MSLGSILAVVDSVTERIGRGVAWLTFGMVAATLLVVTLRYGFDVGAILLQESVIYMHGLVFMLGIAYTLKQNGHVRVDLIYSRLTLRQQHWVNLTGHVLCLLPVGLFIFASSLDYVAASWRVLEGSPEVGGMPAVFLLKTLIPVMALTLLLQGAAEALRCVRDLLGSHASNG